MEILTKTELRLRHKEIVKKIDSGAVFIHPTDTIYGIGCNASNKKSVEKIRQLKEKLEGPFSIWVPSLEWVKENCEINGEVNKWLKELPGPYTLILKIKNKDAIADNVNLNKDTIGIRYPDHWFSKVVEEIGCPIVTTSANKSNNPFMTSIENLNQEIKKGVEFMVYEGEKKGRPSKIIDLTKKTEVRLR
ncbi:MAG: L-threonylcarbamoyladenylate synthase [Nanoarchaeota archaeon]|nr:threonylcarbamoyl-AMP synthase [Nanoarchaeota archaeon]MBU1632633.1 threonylcarbamoyl-AMP synthase [Nanoarchaeota archaeon]MBU1876544.1 threonylcarbamoyl-AMP synthase [Nanoarchaeota archaeon]